MREAREEKKNMNGNNNFSVNFPILDSGNWERPERVDEVLEVNPSETQRTILKDARKKDCKACSIFSKALILITLRKSQQLQDPKKRRIYLRSIMKVETK